ncbi:MAG: hypothetical protein KDA87_17245 [Planctomycetales bacterium]|nr:hypothetical protein [Planctomycetales bacterium]
MVAWDEFSDAEKQKLMKDDSEAWNKICTILLAIISIGLGIAFLAILIDSILF